MGKESAHLTASGRAGTRSDDPLVAAAVADLERLNARIRDPELGDSYGNFYQKGEGVYNAGHHDFGTPADSDVTRIQAAIDAAVADSIPLVMVPDSMIPYDASSVSFDASAKMIREGQQTDVFDVRAYGAALDGTTDDTRSVQEAMNATPGTSALGGGPATGTVFFPEGNARVTSTLAFNGPIQFQGANKVASSVLIDHNGIGFRSNVQGTEPVFHPRWQDLTINQGSARPAGSIAIDLRGISFANIVRCRLRNHERGIRGRNSVGGGFYNEIRECEIASCTFGVDWQNGANSNRIVGGRFQGNTTGLRISQSGQAVNESYVAGVAFEQNDVGIELADGCRTATVIQCRFEGQNVQGLQIKSGASQNLILGGEYSNTPDLIDDQGSQNIILVSDNSIADPFALNVEVRRTDINRETLGATQFLGSASNTFQNLDPGGSTRVVRLPAEEAGREFIIANRAATGSGQDLTLQNDATTSIYTINPQEVVRAYSDGTGWIVLPGVGFVS